MDTTTRRPRFRARTAALGLAVALLAGCHESGTWKDDPKNWARIFGGPKPADVTVVHSYHWRSPHFTHECETYIQVRTNRALQDAMVSGYGLREATADEVARLPVQKDSRPAWFAPKAPGAYRVWIRTNAPADFEHLQLWVDRTEGDLFLTNRQ